eukprot:gene1837-2010_t
MSSPNESSRAESVKVLVRVRPLSVSEAADGNNNEETAAVHLTSSSSLSLSSADQKKTFQCSYDAVLGPFASQAQVYDKVKECTLAVMNGINATIFAYGQTGSGKTHSMYGPPNYINSQGRETDQLGVIPRAIHHIFDLARNPTVMDFQVHCSFVQIYNENLYDMLRDPAMNIPLTIREDKNEIYVQGLSEYNVKSVSDTLQLLKIAEDNRAIRETHMNLFSSRSHSIFQIFVDFKRVAKEGGIAEGEGEVSYRAKFNLVDLAGSEKWDMRRELREEHIAEMTNINLSLHTLGKCISALAKASRKRQKENISGQKENVLERSWTDLDTRSVSSLDLNHSTPSLKSKPSTANSAISSHQYGNHHVHVPYRESKLTRLLQDSLGGSAKTFLLATISPARCNVDESISTLKFADRAKQVMVQAVINESRPVDYAVVKKLQQDVEVFKGLLQRVVGLAEEDRVRSLLQPTSGLSESERLYLSQAMRGNGNAPMRSSSPTKPDPTSTMSSKAALLNKSINTSTSIFNAEQQQQHQQQQQQQQYREEDQEQQGGGSASSAGSASASGGVEKGSGLEYVISLEKALNKEQVHAQHLTKKNETLIKELEELKMINMRLSCGQQLQESDLLYLNTATYSGRAGSGSSTSTGVNKNTSSGPLPPNEVKEAMDSVKQLVRQTSDLIHSTEQIQKVVKRFFKFQLEEEDMKKELTKIFDELKDHQNGQLVDKVLKSCNFLESYAGSLPATATKSSSSTTAAKAMTAMDHNAQYEPMISAPYIRSNKKGGGGNNSSSSGNGGKAVVTVPPRNLPQLPSSQPALQSAPVEEDFHFADDTTSKPVVSSSEHDHRRKNRHSASEAESVPFSGDYHDQPLSPYDSTLQQGGQGQGHHSAGSLGLSFRLRAGPAGGAPTPGQTTSQHDKWIVHDQQEEQMTEEERLRQELKKAKKKQKQQEKLQMWMKEKEERAQAELKAQEDEKKAMQEAELAKEIRRREYLSKQKAKLSSYQERVKSEAEKIQELVKLGIDPKSLNLG